MRSIISLVFSFSLIHCVVATGLGTTMAQRAYRQHILERATTSLVASAEVQSEKSISSGFRQMSFSKSLAKIWQFQKMK
jgi:hypothetical protein